MRRKTVVTIVVRQIHLFCHPLSLTLAVLILSSLCLCPVVSKWVVYFPFPLEFSFSFTDDCQEKPHLSIPLFKQTTTTAKLTAVKNIGRPWEALRLSPKMSHQDLPVITGKARILCWADHPWRKHTHTQKNVSPDAFESWCLFKDITFAHQQEPLFVSTCKPWGCVVLVSHNGYRFRLWMAAVCSLFIHVEQ